MPKYLKKDKVLIAALVREVSEEYWNYK